MTKPQQRDAETETEKGETSSPAPALHVLRGRGRSIIMCIWHSLPFPGVTCVLLAGGCNQTYGPQNIVAKVSRLDLYAHHTWFPSSTRQKRALSARMPAVDWQGGADCPSKGIFLPMGGHGILGVFEEHFLHCDDFPRSWKWLTSVDEYPSTMERKLVVGIRDFYILSNRKVCLEGNEKEKLTRKVLSVLMVAQKSTRRRVEWIKWGLFTVGFFVWSTPHFTVCPARWLVSSSSVCNPSSDPFVKSHRIPSSFTLCNIFWGISLPKTEQKDHFSCQFFKKSNSQSDSCDEITWPSFTFSILSYYILSLLKIWSRYHE